MATIGQIVRKGPSFPTQWWPLNTGRKDGVVACFLPAEAGNETDRRTLLNGASYTQEGVVSYVDSLL